MASRSYWKGTCEPFCDVDVAPVTAWIERTLLDPETRTATAPCYEDFVSRHIMVSRLDWNDGEEHLRPLMDKVMADHFPGCRILQHLISPLMVGQTIAIHADQQPPDWIVRVHVPITTNPEAIYCNPPVEHNMEVGKAYLINTKEPHQCWNNGKTDRIHFMWDVLGPIGYGVQ